MLTYDVWHVTHKHKHQKYTAYVFQNNNGRCVCYEDIKEDSKGPVWRAAKGVGRSNWLGLKKWKC